MVFIYSIKAGRNPHVAPALWAPRRTQLLCVKWGALTPAPLSHGVMAARRMKNSYLNTISLMCSHGEYPRSWRQSYHQDLARTYPLWYPYHFRAQRLQRSSPGQNHLMETWYRKVRYFLFWLKEHTSLEPNPFSSCATLTKTNLDELFTRTRLDCERWVALLPKQFCSHSEIACVRVHSLSWVLIDDVDKFLAWGKYRWCGAVITRRVVSGHGGLLS